MSENNIMNLSDEAQEFLWYSCFSTDYKTVSKDTDKAMNLCVQRAYLDLNRTLSFNTDNKVERKDFRDAVCNEITNGIKKKLLSCDKSIFDKNHAMLCNHIIKVSKSKNILKSKDDNTDCFCYGQAQKWLNMTLKYMLIMGFWTEKLTLIMDVLHVPVDSYIMEAASELEIEIPRNNERHGKYTESSSKPWSKWEEKDYTKFQNDLRTALNNKNPTETPIRWECHAWIEVAQKRKARRK